VKQELKDLAKHRLERAENTLLDAQKYFKNATLSSTVNRIYYAMFYAVNGLLIAKGLSSSKHSGVRALFNKEFINKGIVEKNEVCYLQQPRYYKKESRGRDPEK